MSGNELKRAAASLEKRETVQVKVCGLTRVEEAVACAQAGAAAVGCVFYAKSPRCVTTATARAIRRALPPEVACVGVFVDEPFEGIMATGSSHRLHRRPASRERSAGGCRAPAPRGAFRHQGALCRPVRPSLKTGSPYSASAYLVECGQGPLPGGNAQDWDWGRAGPFAERHPLILAGGLTPENAAQAVRAALPDAVDVSSGVEAGPGRKDIRKVEQFIAAVTDGQRKKEDIRMNLSHASLKEAHGRLPDAAGHFGPFGGRYIAETLMPAILELEEAYRRIAPAPDVSSKSSPACCGTLPAVRPLCFSPNA